MRRTVGIEGVGLHSGAQTRVEILPAPVNHGLLFARRDLGGREIPASPEAIGDSSLATTLGRDGASIATVEHLLAALQGLGIDNARIEVDGPEIPILDGSAAPFVNAIRRVGTTAQNAARRPVTVKRPLTVRDGERAILALPSRDFRISYAIDFPHPAIGYQAVALALDEEVFAASIAPARTFCLLRDVQAMRASGRARGGSLDNAVVVGDEGIVGGALRFRDEFVRHKVLDLIGDLALLGAPLQAHVVVFKGGHRLHAQLVRRLRDGAVAAASAVAPHPPQWYDRFSHLGERLVPRPSVLTA
ncbi:MAG TPA: UDP-3-O-acyl-N-acetylglucosamine deacetylase [Candidatus Polarisedimenticolia bacterium]|nr:UDP-3-O-acyl-N-acetylglucosamine deacetylase [Candidatus Polarisedimenticolia bacterium]